MKLRNGVVVAPQPLAVEVGVSVLRDGGNAFDAGVAAALIQTIADPQMCGIAGFGVANCLSATTGQHVIVNFYDRAPLAATPDMFAATESDEVTGDYFPVRDDANQIGYRSVGTPGTLAGLFDVQRRFGRMPWREIVAPAVHHARVGVRIHPDVARYWRTPATQGNLEHRKKLQATDACAAIYTKDGRLLEEGGLLVNADYAGTLETIGSEGADAFYRGDIARRIAEDFQANGGLLTRDDLAGYRVRVTPPVTSTYRGFRIASTPPPGGGVIVAKLLNILEGFDLGGMSRSSAEYVHHLASAMRVVFADRAQLWGDPEFVDIPVARLLSKRHAAARRRSIGLSVPPDDHGGVDSPTTTHLSVIDRDGNVTGITHTLGASSGVVVPGLGFMFNNAMHKFDPRPGRANSIAPGKSRASALSPTVVFNRRRPWMVLGSPGAFGIITGVAQAIINVVDHGDSPLEAVSVPRLHCEGEVVNLEARYPTWIDDELEARGHRVRRSLLSYDLDAGLVHCAHIDHAKGRSDGGADPRRGGMALTDD